MVVDAAAIGVPLQEWLEYPGTLRRLIIRTHNERHTR